MKTTTLILIVVSAFIPAITFAAFCSGSSCGSTDGYSYGSGYGNYNNYNYGNTYSDGYGSRMMACSDLRNNGIYDVPCTDGAGSSYNSGYQNTYQTYGNYSTYGTYPACQTVTCCTTYTTANTVTYYSPCSYRCGSPMYFSGDPGITYYNPY